jgi:hypothetical protein
MLVAYPHVVPSGPNFANVAAPGSGVAYLQGCSRALAGSAMPWHAIL